MTSKDDSCQAAKVLYDLEMGLWEADMGKLKYDEKHDWCRFRDGRFAFSKTKANWKLLHERGYTPYHPSL